MVSKQQDIQGLQYVNHWFDDTIIMVCNIVH